jgi:5-methylcytosine-specific restriction enzyme A
MPLTECAEPGCRVLVKSGRCKDHQRDRRRQIDHERGSAHQRGYTRVWSRASQAFLRENPLCAICEREGRLVPATVTDHVAPHRGDPELFWSRSNWQALCKPCHDSKTATEDGGFGRRYHDQPSTRVNGGGEGSEV